jgi:NAD(P)-dependent dehydrogenase (short-subunit alcohol dehydrogenase family)
MGTASLEGVVSRPTTGGGRAHLQHGRPHAAATGPRAGARPGLHPHRRTAAAADPRAGGGANSGAAYAISKQANHLRVQAAALTWGDRGARINSISPGIILTPLARDEMSGPGAPVYQK